MLKNYLLVAFRNLSKNKAFSFINIVGLAIGMTACFLIYINIKFELSYDSFNKKFDQIYRVSTDIKHTTFAIKTPSSFLQMGPSLQQDYPEVKANTRISNGHFLVQYGEVKFQEDNGIFADPSLFTVFTLPVVKGDVKKGFKAPFTVVITETTAKKYFGRTNPIGKSLLLNDKYAVLVAAVVKDMPPNSHFKFDMAISFATREKLYPNSADVWADIGCVTYIELPKGYDYRKLQSLLPAFASKHYTQTDKKEGTEYSFLLQPLKDVYMDAERGGAGDLHNIRIFSIIALFILLIACINFINLTTARATERAKEVGIRKVIGAARKQLIVQFLSESVIICLIAFLFSTLFSYLLLPLFNQLSGKVISISIFSHSYVFRFFILSCGIGVIAGLYPALVLSGFKPITTLRGRFSKSSVGVLLRKGLVITQFTISIVLIIGTIIVYYQLHYMRSQALGFQKNQMLVIDFHMNKAIQNSAELIKNELKKVPNVVSATASMGIPGFGYNNRDCKIENSAGTMQQMLINLYEVDYDFIPQFEMKLMAGRIFSKSFGTDTAQAIVINETASKILGYRTPAEAIGQNFSQDERTGKIIGVLKDFHYESLKTTVQPLCMRINPARTVAFTIKIKSKNIPETIAGIQSKWKALAPERPFNYAFVDETFNKQYAAQETFGNLFLYFAVLAILISCMGLFGLASYSTIQRSREIGIRKVFGASVTGIVNMLSVEFLRLVIISSLIAFPLAWFAMSKWLQDFAYRITIDWWVFALAGVMALIIAFTTVSFQAIKAALANPVDSLRSE
ncbi:FtsX-like permease family protein [Mucilaginibacter sp. NFX135]|uniref:FtsX-like permease family protein n=1 Tax=Mucilaginibacter sp. NFX135 TaxID=3402687 RepID=UPI003AFB43E5